MRVGETVDAASGRAHAKRIQSVSHHPQYPALYRRQFTFLGLQWRIEELRKQLVSIRPLQPTFYSVGGLPVASPLGVDS